jgi:hypothetical protein
MATVEPKVKYLLLPIGVNGKSDGMSPVEAEGIVAGYLAQGYTIIATTISAIGPDGMVVAHALVK